MSLRDRILAKLRTVPALPAAAIETVQLLQDPDSDIKDIARSIEHDPGLTANVLKLANSAYIGMSKSVGTIQQAVVRIGTAEIVKMIVGLSFSPIASRPVRGYDLPPGALWEHSVAVAVASEQIVRLREINPPPHTFTPGLLIDVGKLVLGNFVEVDITSIQKLAFDQQASFEKAERQVLGIDHAEVGARLLEHWNLPEALVEVVRWHHDPSNVSEEQALVTDLVHTADQLMTLCGIGCGADGSNYAMCDTAVSRFSLSDDEVELVLSRSMEVFDKVRLKYKCNG